MEEKNEVTKKLTYDQLKQVALQLQNRLMQAEENLASINLITMRLDYLFKVLNKAPLFPKEFINKCIAEIIDKLEVKDNSKVIKDSESNLSDGKD